MNGFEPFSVQTATTIPNEPGSPDEYVMERLSPEHEGWFPLGEVSLVAGSSGTGKTTWILQLLEKVRQGQNAFGHRAAPRPYCILLHDRSKASFRRTLRRMHLPKEIENCVYRLTPDQQKSQPYEVIGNVLAQNKDTFQIVVVEGLDMWVPSGKTGDLVTVAAFLDELQRVAEKWKVAIIGSVGCPKQKPKDRYEMQRDSVFGSVALGRKVETIVFLQLADFKDPNSLRECYVLTRQGKAEKFVFGFQGGQLVDVSQLRVPSASTPVKKSKLALYLDTLQPGEPVRWSLATGMSEATFYRQLQDAHKAGLVFKQDGTTYKATDC